MKCHKCGANAAIQMRQHRLQLCAVHFVEWVTATTQRAIETYEMFTPADRLLVAVSGGKDSLSLWDLLLTLGYQAEGLYINLGIDEGIDYSAKSLEMCRKFVADHHPTARLHVVDVGAEYGQGIPMLARTKRRGQAKPCAVCGLVKRHIMNRVARDGGFAAIATGHNLDDEAAVLMQNTLHWQTGYLARQAPVLEKRSPSPERDFHETCGTGSGLARKVKPLVRLYERESAAYALIRGLDYIYDECPFAKGSTTNFYKELLNQLELKSPGAKQQFYLQFLRARDAGRVTFAEGDDLTLQPCARCGQPTTAGDLCAFCRLWE
ncbi:MAG: adenine nucleotide alpha hydrolase family protein [Anaerolineae bacterium]|nr:adenine nucleotide alpha hydrolase family protein [Anaerolineae bacterium]